MSENQINFSHADRVTIDKNLIQDGANQYRQGNANVGIFLLADITSSQNWTGTIKDVAREFEKAGTAGVSYDEQGEVKELIFNGDPNKKNALSIDLKDGTLNGKNYTELFHDAKGQALEYLSAQLPNYKSELNKDGLTPEAQSQMKYMVGAIFDGNESDVADIAKLINRNPEMAKSIEQAMNDLLGHSPVEFNVHLNAAEEGKYGIPSDAAFGRSNDIVVSGGGVRAAIMDDDLAASIMKLEPFDSHKLGGAVAQASNDLLNRLSEDISMNERYLAAKNLIKDEDYTDMKALVKDSKNNPHWRD